MLKAIVAAVLDWLAVRIGAWWTRRDLERTRDEQQANDARDRGPTRDIIDRMRQRAEHEPPDRR